MTSKNYLCNSIKENIRRNFYLMILLALAFLAALPVWTMMEMEYAKYIEPIPGALLKPVQQRFLDCIGPSNFFVAVIVIGAAVLLGMTGFSYLYSGEKTDFYHSLPLKREQLFLVSFCNNFVLLVVPYVIALAVTYVVGFAYGGVTAQAVTAMWSAVGMNLLYFLVLYAVVVLAVLLTGNLFTGVLGAAGFMSYGLIAYAAYTFMNRRFFETITQWHNSVKISYLSPIAAYVSALEACVEKHPVKEFVIYGIILAVVLLVLDVCLYRCRPSESFQKAIAFEKLQPVIKVLCVIPISILAGLFFSEGMERQFAWMLFSTLIAGVLLSAVFEFLYTMDIRKCIKIRTSAGIILAALFFILMGYHFDITGMDDYLPEKEKVEAMSIYFDSIDGRISYPAGPEQYRSCNVGEYLDKNRVESFDSVYELAKTGVEYCAENKNTQKFDREEVMFQNVNGIKAATEEAAVVSFYIAYHLKTGKTVYRLYYAPETEEVVKMIGDVYDNWEYRERMLPTTYLKEEKVDYFYVRDFYDIRKQLNINGEMRENLYKTYKSELESMTFEQSRKNRIIGYLLAEQKVKTLDGSAYTEDCELPVYENFVRTKAFLEKAGFPLKDNISAEDVFEIKLYRNNAEGEIKELVLERPEEMETILEKLTFGEGYYGVGSNLDYSVNVEISWKDRDISTQTNLYLEKSKELQDILKQLKDD